jgi:hypothetical protein
VATFRVYAHVLPHQQREVAALLRVVLSSGSEGDAVDNPLTGTS